MRWSGALWLAVIAMAGILQNQQSVAAPSPQHDNMWKTLLELDRMYSSVARPSVRSGPAIRSEMSPKVQRAINVLKLQHLEQLYADRARPRFGKRTGEPVPYEPTDYENGDFHGEPGEYFPFQR